MIFRALVKSTVGTCAVFTFFDVVGHPAQVVGNSMYPTLQANDSRWYKRDFVWLSHWSLHKCSPGVILTFTRRPHLNSESCFPEKLERVSNHLRSPRDSSSTYIKRLSAVEGQLVRPEKHPEMLIPKGHYWMEGDNPVNRNDSNVFGPVSKGLIKGRATHIIWPPSRWQALKNKI